MKVFIITGRSLLVIKITRQTSKIIRTCRSTRHSHNERTLYFP